MNRSDARIIINALRPLNVERQLVLLDYFQSKHYDGLLILSEEEAAAVEFITSDATTTQPWRHDDDTFDEVREAIETDMIGICDCCGAFSALRNGEAAGSEASMCKWGCGP